MLKRLVLVILLIGVLFGGIFAWKYQQMQEMAAAQSQPQPPAVVAATEVTRDRWQPYLSAVGSLVAVQGVAVTAEEPGKVASIHFESGKRIAKDAVLVHLDASTDEATLEGLRAELRLAQLQFERTERLYRDKTLSKADLDEARAKLDSARAQVARQQALIRKKTIRAPFSGLLGIRQVDVGEYLEAGADIVPLEQLDPIHVDYSLPERHFAAIAEGQTVQVQVNAYPERRFSGRVTALNARIDAATRSIRVRATLDNPDRLLRPGMFAEVRTLLPQQEAILTLPRNAITYAPYGDSVFLIEERDGALTVQRKPVETGEVRGNRVEVTGLEAGQRVVAAGQVKLRNDQAVTLDDKPVLGAQGQ